ncbi:FG-GAP repeat domain-containing protein [Blastococcus litoris]|uniref:FG-GAP repeat domain-containing protein n=1 Tax=Blastococcus litoris TaxID=2171622 RepID=UPI000E3029D3|nr:VCBS repeat-containing protein [Blastococcus litoris]
MPSVRRPFRRPAVVALAVLVTSVALLPRSAVADEVPESVVGELARTWSDQDPAGGGDSGPLSWVRTDDGRTVRIPTEDVVRLEVGSRVQVTLGGEVADEPTVSQGVAPARDVVAAASLTAPVAAAATATNEVTVVRVVPRGGRADGAQIADVVAQVNGPVHDYWAEQTGGGIELSATGWPDWVTVPAGCDDPYGILDQAAAAVGFSPGPGRHLLVYLPYYFAELTNCGQGLGEQGEGPGAGGMAYVKGSETGRIAHELGHNFGLGDSTILKCTTSPSVPSVDEGNCFAARNPVTDFYDVMGGNPTEVGSLGAVHAQLLGFVDPDSERVVVAGRDPLGTYRLSPLGGGTGVRTLQIAVPGGAGPDVYWLEYRAATGQDAWLGDARNYYGLDAGVLLRHAGPDLDHTSVLLDGTPSTAGGVGDLQVALPVGAPVHLARAGLSITVQSLTAGQATVRVAADPPGSLPRDRTEDLVADVLAADPAGGLQLYPGSGGGGFAPRRTVGSGWTGRDQLMTTGDWNGDGHDDVLARNPGNGDLWLYTGDGRGGFFFGRVVGIGWGGFDAVFSPGDWNGDGPVDLLARRRGDGALLLYPGNGTGAFGSPSVVGTGWGGMTDLSAGGDWNRDGLPDLVARDWAGYLHLYSGNGTGGFSGQRTIGVGWQGFAQIVGPGDWDGDGRSDLLAQAGNGALVLYPGDGEGGFLASRPIGSGWTGFRLFD